MSEELQERDYLALSAIVDAPDSVLRFDNLGDIPTEVIGRLQGMGLVLVTFIGWKATFAGLDKLALYRAPAAPTPDAGADRPYAYADLATFYELMVSLDAQNETIEKLAATMYEDQYDLDAWAELTVVCERLHDARKADAGGVADAGAVGTDTLEHANALIREMDKDASVLVRDLLAAQAENTTLRTKLSAAEAENAALKTRIEWAEEILENVEDHAPKDYDKFPEVKMPLEWYMTGVYVREYRAEYPKVATPPAPDTGK